MKRGREIKRLGLALWAVFVSVPLVLFGWSTGSGMLNEPSSMSVGLGLFVLAATVAYAYFTVRIVRAEFFPVVKEEV